MLRANQLFCLDHLSVHQRCHLFPLAFRASSPLLLCLQVVFHLYRLSAHTSGSAGNEVTHQQMHTWMDLHRCALVASSCPCSINNGFLKHRKRKKKIVSSQRCTKQFITKCKRFWTNINKSNLYCKLLSLK